MMEASSSRFTAAEGGARLAMAAHHKNVLAVEYASFIATRLIHEDAYKIRGSLFDGKQRSVYVTRATRVPCVAYELNIMTDLKVVGASSVDDVYDWCAELDKKEVLICTSSVLKHNLEEETLNMADINVLIIDSCHLVWNDQDLQYIMKLYKECASNSRPRILALTYPLFTPNKYDIKEKTKNEDLVSKKETPTEIAEQNMEVDGKAAEVDTIIEKEISLKENLDDKNNVAMTVIADESRHGQDESAISGNKENTAVKIENYKFCEGEVNCDDYDMYEKLEWKIEMLEEELCCDMDLAEDIDGGKRLSSTIAKPKELVIEYAEALPYDALPDAYVELDSFMRNTVKGALDFMNEHRYDPTEIYGEDLYEEFKNIPDPTIEPKFIFYQFLYVLDQLGPYAADKAAFSLLSKLEKLKIKVPYERHFILLCLCTTIFVKIRCYADLIFSKYDSDWDKIKIFSTPKVLRFAEILFKFQPPELQKSTEENTAKMLSDLDKCDFVSLGNRIEDRVNSYEANLKDLEDYSESKLTENCVETNVNSSVAKVSESDKSESIDKAKSELDKAENDLDSIGSKTEMTSEVSVNDKSERADNSVFGKNNDAGSKVDSMGSSREVGKYGFSRRSGSRVRGRGRSQRGNLARVQQLQQNPDALCGIVFMREALMAKIMFMLIVDMSRAHPKLTYLCAQYCAVETPADPGTEPKECQRQSKKQEEVLKKFRMHECNLLLATSTLEEGIDLPRCNLVLRWDTPPSYRSYGLSRGRARASRASCVVMSRSDGSTTEELIHNLAIYRELDQIISRKCDCGIQDEPPDSEESYADTFTLVVKPYTPEEIDKTLKSFEPKQTEDKVDFSTEENATPKEYDSNSCENENVKSIENYLKKVTISHINGIDENTTRKTLNDEDTVELTILNDDKKAKENSKIAREECKETNEDIEKDVDCSVVNEFNELQSNIVNDDGVCNRNSVMEVSSKCANVNIYCNRCNSFKISDNVECSCLNRSVGKSVSRTESTVEGDRKKIGDCDIASVDLSTAIALINRYCGKLPSDTFTRLAPQWWMEEVHLPIPGTDHTRTAYVCTLRLPLNCPVKYNIVGHPMPSRVLARRMVALQACRILHKSGELDNQLMPIGKENFKAAELETNLACNCNNENSDPNDAARPGSTKRRQYYFKKTAWAFTDCQPVIDTKDSEIDPQGSGDDTQPEKCNAGLNNKGNKRNMLYAVVSKLWCALPERYNTRGRRLHAPQNASQAIGILMAREHNDELQIPAFPVYTRSGEVRVSVEYVPDADVRMSPRRGRLIRRFMRFVFAEVLRVRRRGMKLCSEGCTQNNYYIVPTIRSTREDGSTKIDIDWAFLELIYQHTEEKKLSEMDKPILWNQDDDEIEQPDKKVEKEKDRDGKVKEMQNPLLKEGEVFVFDAEKYKEAVVTPWYRNQDQPQFFLVAEICRQLSPDSAFPSPAHASFRAYYLHKYGAKLTQPNQPLLDVDHTSARLNLLTPRYVNRKGVTLPVSSERTRRAKRDRLDQKQILVPELCRVHPFAAPLWFATVALPCVLYRINALLIADEIRRAVAVEVGLGVAKIDESTCPGFSWPPLDFGWSLAEVLSADTEKSDKKKDEEETNEEEKVEHNGEETEKEDSEKKIEEPTKEKTINDILQEKEEAENEFEIGTWSNDMASTIPDAVEYNEYMEPLPPNLTFCTSASGGANWSEPIEKPKSQFNPSRTFSMAESDCSYMSSDFDTDDSDLNSESDEDTESSGFWSKGSLGVRIEYKTAHEAEAVDLERKKKVNPAPQPDERDDDIDKRTHYTCIREGEAPTRYIEKFRTSVLEHEAEILKHGSLVPKNEPVTDILPETKDRRQHTHLSIDDRVLSNLFPYGIEELKICNDQITLESIERNKRVLLNRLKSSLSKEDVKKLNCFSMVDVDIDSPNYVNEKVANVGFDTKECYNDKISKWDNVKEFKSYYNEGRVHGNEFDFDYQPPLEGHPGPSPSVILQALTMSNANDGINLERLETIGDSFLKFAITAYLYCAHPTVHEGKLSHMRSKQVSNQNLYRLGRARRLGARMTASKFEPHDNWLPPCHRPPHTQHSKEQNSEQNTNVTEGSVDKSGCFIPYNLITQHSIPDKSIADCVEALIGAYLLECGPRGALLFMSWLGIRVLPRHVLPLPPSHPYVVAEESRVQKKPEPKSSRQSNRERTDSESSCSEEDEPWQQEEDSPPEEDWGWPARPVGSLRPHRDHNGQWVQPIFGELKAPPSPLLRYIEDPEGELERMLSGYDALERTLQYRFRDRSLLLQALTHASHQTNRLTDCYQRLEFLGDAVLDYLITRHLYEDKRRHSPGALTDLRSALVNNTIFATLAARHGFHKYFRHMSPGLNEVLTKYVKIQEENGHSISEEHYLIQEDEMEQAEDVEVPKALGDLFESVAGAIFLDSGMSLGAVWKSYVNLMGAELEAFSAAAPKSPIRELLEAEPDTAKFGKPERLADGRRVRVCVEVFGRGTFKGVGRNYRIAKGTAARCALRHLRIHRAR